MKEFSYITRIQNLKKLSSDKYDLLIIGGGITGAGVARDASMRGLKVALIEAHDFAFGTSSRSSKLIHGGLRYLENKEFHLVFEALSERTKLFEMAPHLVHPLRFMIPLFKNSRVGMWMMGLGMWLYDALSLFQTPEFHERLNPKQSLEHISILNSHELKGSYIYSDAYMDDDRLVHETLRAAHEEGAVCVNYLKAHAVVMNTHQDHIDKVIAIDQQTGEKIYIEAQHIVCSVGPWTDLVGNTLFKDWKNCLRPTKGIHLTLSKNRLNLPSAVVMAAQESERIVFAIPRHDMIIIGTTDTDYKGDPINAHVTAEDVTYLLNITNQYFPGAKLTAKDIISSYVGVRPLVQDGASSEGQTSREHTIFSDSIGATIVAGGKYTTYRLMAEQVVNETLKFFDFNKKALLKKANTHLPLNPFTTPDVYRQSMLEAETELQKHFTFRYGSEAQEILKKYGFSDNIWCIEAYQAIHTTMCLHLLDFYCRRVPLFLADTHHGRDYLVAIASVFEKELGWTSEQTQQEIQSVIQFIESDLDWKKWLLD